MVWLCTWEEIRSNSIPVNIDLFHISLRDLICQSSASQHVALSVNHYVDPSRSNQTCLVELPPDRYASEDWETNNLV